MGKGDKRSKKGKITIGSYGVSRPRPSAKAKAAPVKPSVPKVKKEKVVAAKPAKTAKPAATAKPVAKPAVKKTVKKKTE